LGNAEFDGTGRKQQRLLKSVKGDSTAQGLNRIDVAFGIGCEESAKVAERRGCGSSADIISCRTANCTEQATTKKEGVIEELTGCLSHLFFLCDRKKKKRQQM
jgi:hypothetical protein